MCGSRPKKRAKHTVLLFVLLFGQWSLQQWSDEQLVNWGDTSLHAYRSVVFCKVLTDLNESSMFAAPNCQLLFLQDPSDIFLSINSSKQMDSCCNVTELKQQRNSTAVLQSRACTLVQHQRGGTDGHGKNRVWRFFNLLSWVTSRLLLIWCQ